MEMEKKERDWLIIAKRGKEGSKNDMKFDLVSCLLTITIIITP